MSINKSLRQELTAMAQLCGEAFTEDEMKEPDRIREALTAIRRRLDTDRGYAFTTARKVGAIPTPGLTPDISTPAARENLGEKTLVKIDELQRVQRDVDHAITGLGAAMGVLTGDGDAQGKLRLLTTRARLLAAKAARAEEDGREAVVVEQRLSELETALGCQLGEGATATVGERFEFLVKRGEKLMETTKELGRLRDEAQQILGAIPSRGRSMGRDEIDMMRDMLLRVAGPTYGWTARHLPEPEPKPEAPTELPSGELAGTWVTTVPSKTWVRLQDSFTEVWVEAQQNTTVRHRSVISGQTPNQLRLPEEPEEGTTVELKGPDGLAGRYRREDDGYGNLYWVQQGVEGEPKAFSWQGLWAWHLRNIVLGGRGENARYMEIVPVPPLPVGAVCPWETRDRVESLPRYSVVRGQGGGIAHREIGDDLKTLSWAISGVTGHHAELGRSWFPVKVIDAGMDA